MRAQLHSWLALLALLASGLASAADDAAKVYAMVDSGAERIRVGQDLSQAMRTGFAAGGLVGGVLLAADQQAAADRGIAALAEPAGKQVAGWIRAGIQQALAQYGQQASGVVFHSSPKPKDFERLRGAENAQRWLVLRSRGGVGSPTAHTVALTPDYQHLQVAFRVQAFEVRRAVPRLVSERDVQVLVSPITSPASALLLREWADDDLRPLRDAIVAGVAEAMRLGLDPHLEQIERPGPGETVDLLTAQGGLRVPGRIFDQRDSSVSIIGADGTLSSLPALRVLQR